MLLWSRFPLKYDCSTNRSSRRPDTDMACVSLSIGPEYERDLYMNPAMFTGTTILTDVCFTTRYARILYLI